MIHFHLENSPITWRHKHVKGHQDSNSKYEDLDVISQANVDVGLMAKDELKKIDKLIHDTSVFQGQCWRIKDEKNNEYIQGNVE